jgi:hypothetical protein
MADADLSSIRTRRYPQQLWLCIASFIAFLCIVHIVKTCRLSFRKRHLERSPVSKESQLVPKRVAASTLQRPFVSIAYVARIILYRTTIPTATGQRLNVAQAAVIIGYIVAIFTWEFINGDILFLQIYKD